MSNKHNVVCNRAGQRNKAFIKRGHDTVTQALTVIARRKIPSCIAECVWKVSHIVRSVAGGRHSVVVGIKTAVSAVVVAAIVTEAGTW